MHRLIPVLLLCACANANANATATPEQVPAPDFVSVTDIDPTIIVEARYRGAHNFIGRPIDGYEAPKCLLARPAAEALKKVQVEARAAGYSLKTYDCYRPQRAVAHFVRWARDASDTTMKAEFYPTLDKSRLFELGYIAERSGHSRGATVDLTLVPWIERVPGSTGYRLRDSGPPYNTGAPLVSCTAPVDQRFADNTIDMGTGYDCFDELSHTANPRVSPEAARNRQVLKAMMEKHGFANYAQEWWHYTFRPEPYPDRYFDVPVR